jgi:hypothetical protein
MIFPAVIEKRHSAVDGPVNNLMSGFFILRIAQVVTTQTEDRDRSTGLTERTLNDGSHFFSLCDHETCSTG